MSKTISTEQREKISRTLKERYANGLKAGFQKGHSLYNKKLEEWRKDGGVPWNKGLTGKKSHSFGVIFSEETKRKIANKLVGNKNTLGHKHSEKTKKKMSEIKKGKPLLKMRGKNHPRWIKDRSKVKGYDERNNPAYKEWAKQIKKRDNNSCRLKTQECSGYNIVHHILNWSKYPEDRYKLNNGITLCQFHHPRKRAEERRLIPILKHLVGSN